MTFLLKRLGYNSMNIIQLAKSYYLDTKVEGLLLRRLNLENKQ